MESNNEHRPYFGTLMADQRSKSVCGKFKATHNGRARLIELEIVGEFLGITSSLFRVRWCTTCPHPPAAIKKTFICNKFQKIILFRAVPLIIMLASLN